MAEHTLCDTCFHSRVIISENGYHSVCCLSDKNALDCIIGKKVHYISKLPKGVMRNEL